MLQRAQERCGYKSYTIHICDLPRATESYGELRRVMVTYKPMYKKAFYNIDIITEKSYGELWRAMESYRELQNATKSSRKIWV